LPKSFQLFHPTGTAIALNRILAQVSPLHRQEPEMKAHLLSSTATRLCVALSSTALLASCASYEPSTGRDTGIGAATGAAIGAMAHSSNRTHGAVAGAAIGALGGYIWSNHMAKQKRDMEAATQGTGVEVTQTADNQLKLNVPSDVSFATGSAAIKPAFDPILNRFAQTLNENPRTTVRIIGHTDSTGNDAINDPLSVNRAASVRNYLVSHGVAGNRIAIDGRGSREPIADNGTDAGRAQNRRVDIFVAESAA